MYVLLTPEIIQLSTPERHSTYYILLLDELPLELNGPILSIY